MFWSKRKLIDNKVMEEIYKILKIHKDTLDLQDRQLQDVKTQMNLLAQNTNNSLMQFNAMLNQAMAHAAGVNDQVTKNLEIFRECSVRMQLMQTVGQTVSDFQKRMAQVEEMSRFVLTGLAPHQESQKQRTVTQLRPVS